MLSSSIDQVAATSSVALAYLVLVRLVDVNEREPIWSLLLAFVLGGAASGALNLGIDRVLLNFDTWPGAALRELALFVAVGATFRILTAIGRLQGWSEVSDVVDGLIYGGAAGLGFTCGELIANLDPTPSLSLATGSLVGMVGRSAASGLAQGVFGAVLGAGFGLAAARSTRARWIWPFAALAAAILLHGAHDVLAHGDALGGEAAMWRSRLALALPFVAVVVLGAVGLLSERRAIADELASEASTGYVTADELALLTDVARRQGLYLRLLATARLRRLRMTAALHNRQVMLALAKRRVAHATHEADRADARHAVDALRRAILAIRKFPGPASENG